MHRLSLSLALLLVSLVPVCAAPTDIVSPGAAVNDCLAGLAARGYLGPENHPNEFTSDRLHTRMQLAQIVDDSIIGGNEYAALGKDPSSAALADAAIRFLRPELASLGVDVDDAITALHPAASPTPLGLAGTIAPEERLKTGGTSKSASMLIYRALATQPSARFSWVLSGSNWAEEWRRQNDNDKGASDFQGVNEGYLRYDGGRGVEIWAGRFIERWGPAMRGAELVSDNVPAFDGLKLAFPFSLGPRLGQNWRYTQFGASFNDYAGVRYFEGRRIELALSPLWNFQFEEAFKSSYERSLEATPMPFLIYKGTNLDYIDDKFNYNADLGLSYAANENSRIYTQFFIDDFKSPLRGRLLGFNVGSSTSVTPRRIGYLVGTTTDALRVADLTVEYAFADPSSNVFQNNNAAWERGLYDYIGMPNGPNTQEFSARLDRSMSSRLRVGAAYRDRRRHDNSYPEPTSRDAELIGSYRLGTRDSVSLRYIVYRQDPFTGPATNPNPFVPISLGNYGTRVRTQEIDTTYQVSF